MILYLDTETFCETPINHGTHRYAEEAEVLLLPWAIDDDPVIVREGTPENLNLLDLLVRSADEVVLHHSRFDRTVLRKNGVAISVEQVWDTMAQARTVGLPGGLGQLCEILGVPVDKAKDKAGKQLIQLFCKPRKTNNAAGQFAEWVSPLTGETLYRATKETHPAEWQRFIEYAGLDVEAMREVRKRLPTWNYAGGERALWELDQRINDRGFAVDVPLVEAAIATVNKEQAALKKRVADMTDGEIDSAQQRNVMLAYLRPLVALAGGWVSEEQLASHQLVEPDEQVALRLELALPDLQKGTLERRVNDPDLPEFVRELLAIRLEASTTSTAKYKKLLNAISSDGRLRGALEFCGAARTGRWSGRLFQPQNLPRTPDWFTPAEQAATVGAIKSGACDLLFDDPIKRASMCLRGVIVPADRKKLVAADLSNIEGRVLAWLADEEWKLDAFRAFDAGTGPDLYLVTAGEILRKPPEEVTKDERQSTGKVPELACGYQGAVGAFSSMAQLYGLELPEREVLKIVRAWRARNANIVKLWYALEDYARSAVRNPGTTIAYGRLLLRRDGAWLRIGLPSGRALCYPSPRVDDGVLSYMGINQYTRKWERILTYGGKLAENVTQAVARDVLAAAMPVAEGEGFEVVLTVHDEIITEAPANDNEFTAGRLETILSTNPSWAEGLPLAAQGFEAYRYGK